MDMGTTIGRQVQGEKKFIRWIKLVNLAILVLMTCFVIWYQSGLAVLLNTLRLASLAVFLLGLIFVAIELAPSRQARNKLVNATVTVSSAAGAFMLFSLLPLWW